MLNASASRRLPPRIRLCRTAKEHTTATQTLSAETTLVPEIDWDCLRRAAYASCRHIPSWVPRDDLIQEANLAAWQATSRWREDGGSSFTNFVTQRAVGAVRDVLREHAPLTRSGRVRLSFVCLGEGVDPPTADRDTVLDIGLRETLERAMDRLRPRERQVVTERFFHNRTNGEVGRDLGITDSAVSLIATKALKRLEQDFSLRDWVGLAA